MKTAPRLTLFKYLARGKFVGYANAKPYFASPLAKFSKKSSSKLTSIIS